MSNTQTRERKQVAVIVKALLVLVVAGGAMYGTKVLIDHLSSQDRKITG